MNENTVADGKDKTSLTSHLDELKMPPTVMRAMVEIPLVGMSKVQICYRTKLKIIPN